MAVASRGAALSALRTLLNHDQVPVDRLLHHPYLPTSLTPSGDPVRMDPSTMIGGYGDEARYVLRASDEATRTAIAGAPAEVLSGRPSITTSTVEQYVKASLDLTMEGGTTSGVVYPLAVCELATSFRFRNVGGASAGAIAAALTAAAELGRSGRVLADAEQGGEPGSRADNPRTSEQTRTPASEHEVAGVERDPQRAERAIRAGFVGLTDVIGWLTQTRPGDAEKDEFRLAQLFRPGSATVNIFRVVVAVMRGQTWSLPLVALVAFGWVTRIVAVALLLGALTLTGFAEGRLTRTDHSWPAVLGLGLVGILSFVATGAGLLIAGQALYGALKRPARSPIRTPRWLDQLRLYTSAYAVPTSTTLRRVVVGCALLAVVVLVAILRPALYVCAILVGLAVSLVLIGVMLASVLAYVGDFRSRRYGFVPGTTPPRKRNLLDVLAGAPRPTVQPSLVPWLNDCMNSLAGLPHDQVLRFGHLWAGLDYGRQRLDLSEDAVRRRRQLSARTDHRLVNLELMTTDLSRQRPFRFPLDPCADHDSEQLWVCVDQLRDGESQIFPDSVLAVLAETEQREVVDRGGVRRTLHKLPQPWDLPVIFAVRISMSLPALFQAVRLYRIVENAPISDDFGRVLLEDGHPVQLMNTQASASGDGSRLGIAEELWFSDGGITSNFPVHFFDNPLPRWPTVSLNLGTHPDDAPHQDVWLPQDWDDVTIQASGLTPSGLSFAGAIFNTAMSWRDSTQSSLPGYRNRIAQVRTSPGEGGTNLFMPREVIASMALRGALAGARLRTRFSDDTQWNRFRWLRLRTAMSNMERLRASSQARRGFYADAFSGRDWLDRQIAEFHDTPLTRPISWYPPPAAFWPKAARLLTTFSDAYRPTDDAANVMCTGVPLPEPVLRQVPNE